VFEIGNSLHEARVRRSIEFNQAEVATKIRAKYLRALEDERFEQLPSQTYNKGFLRTYAEYLGLDGQLYVDEYNSRFVAGEDADLRSRRADARPRRSTVRNERRTRRLETSVVLLAVAVVGIVTLVVITAWQTSGSGVKTPAARHKIVKPPKHPVAHVSRAYLQITAVDGTSYVEVHKSGPAGKLLFEGTIEKGKMEPFKTKYLWVNLSSPENLHMVVGGQTVPLSGHKPIALTITPGGVHAN
jgi:cytoskeletal protein RodZ